MARTPEGEAAARRHRREQLAVRAELLQQLVELWPLWDVEDIASYGRFTRSASTLVRDWHPRSADVAARFFREFRELEGVEGSASPIRAEPPSVERVRDALRATGLQGTLRARRAGKTLRESRNIGLTLVSGAASREVLAGGRGTVVESVREDPVALGWVRVTDADPCYWCRMLASRGVERLYRSEETASFEAHNNCACTAAPHYEGAELPGRNREYQELWQRSTRGLSGKDAVNAFRRAVEDRSRDDDPINTESGGVDSDAA